MLMSSSQRSHGVVEFADHALHDLLNGSNIADLCDALASRPDILPALHVGCIVGLWAQAGHRTRDKISVNAADLVGVDDVFGATVDHGLLVGIHRAALGAGDEAGAHVDQLGSQSQGCSNLPTRADAAGGDDRYIQVLPKIGNERVGTDSSGVTSRAGPDTDDGIDACGLGLLCMTEIDDIVKDGRTDATTSFVRYESFIIISISIVVVIIIISSIITSYKERRRGVGPS